MNTSQKNSLIVALLFIIFAHPAVVRWTDRNIGKKVFKSNFASPAGAPTTTGLFVHALVAALAYYFITKA